MNDQLLLRGARLSLLLHGLILSSVVYVATILPELTPPLIIDFSITNDCSAAHSCNPSPEQTEPVREVLPQSPPVEEKAVAIQPEPVETKITTGTSIEPEKTEAPKPAARKIISVQAKKRLLVVKKPQEPVVELSPEPAAEVLPSERPPKEIETSPHTSQLKTSLERQATASLETPAANESQTTSSSPKERYAKANFSFIREAIDRNTTYPNIARKMGWEGKVLISFTILADGQVKNIRVVESCGFTALDSSAVNTIKRCAPFPKPPLEAEITLPITYRLD